MIAKDRYYLTSPLIEKNEAVKDFRGKIVLNELTVKSAYFAYIFSYFWSKFCLMQC